MSEQTLVTRLKEGAAGAFEELVKAYGRRLYSVAFRIVRNKQDAEDTVQETFLKVFQSIGSFREDSSLYTWLYKIVTNESIMKLRARAKAEMVSIDDYLPQYEYGQHTAPVQDWTPFPDLALESKELAVVFEKCVDELPEQYRLPYILKDIEKLSEDEVCEVLDLSKPAMKNRVHRARLVIRKRIQEHFSHFVRR